MNLKNLPEMATNKSSKLKVINGYTTSTSGVRKHPVTGADGLFNNWSWRGGLHGRHNREVW